MSTMKKMDTKKVQKLIRLIWRLKYQKDAMKNVETFESTLAVDLGTGKDTHEAMGVLGYLLSCDYARIIPGMGIVLNPSSVYLQQLAEEGFFGGKN